MTASTAKGNQLEDLVFSLVPDWIKEGDIPVSQKYELYRRKSYHSKLRQGPINFENVVELISAKNSDPLPQPFLVIIFECKNLTRPVDVQEVEEFSSKLDGVLGFRTKGFIVSRVGFSKMALSRARNAGIGLIRIMPDEQVQLLTHFMTAELLERLNREFPKRAASGLTQPDYISEAETLFGEVDGYVFDRAGAMIKHAVESLSERE